jgi:hypothetical protein
MDEYASPFQACLVCLRSWLLVSPQPTPTISKSPETSGIVRGLKIETHEKGKNMKRVEM